jgi:hypothetical protein
MYCHSDHIQYFSLVLLHSIVFYEKDEKTQDVISYIFWIQTVILSMFHFSLRSLPMNRDRFPMNRDKFPINRDKLLLNHKGSQSNPQRDTKGKNPLFPWYCAFVSSMLNIIVLLFVAVVVIQDSRLKIDFLCLRAFVFKNILVLLFVVIFKLSN